MVNRLSHPPRSASLRSSEALNSFPSPGPASAGYAPVAPPRRLRPAPAAPRCALSATASIELHAALLSTKRPLSYACCSSSRALRAPRLRCGALSAPPLSDRRSSRGIRGILRNSSSHRERLSSPASDHAASRCAAVSVSCGRPPTPPRVHRASCALRASRASPVASRLRYHARRQVVATRAVVIPPAAPRVCAGRQGRRCCAALSLPALGLAVVSASPASGRCRHSRYRRLVAAVRASAEPSAATRCSLRRSQRRAICSRALLLSTIGRRLVVGAHARGRGAAARPPSLPALERIRQPRLSAAGACWRGVCFF